MGVVSLSDRLRVTDAPDIWGSLATRCPMRNYHDDEEQTGSGLTRDFHRFYTTNAWQALQLFRRYRL